MPISKQNLAIPFATSLDTKTDPFQVMPTNMLSLVNAVFTKDKRIQKRNGFNALSSLPSSDFNANYTTLATFNGNLTAIGNNFLAFDEESSQWIDKGRFQPVKLNTLSLLRNSVGQTAIDTASSGTLTIVAYQEAGEQYYQISDNTTSQQLLAPVALPSGAKSARTFVLGNYFIVTFIVEISSTPNLRYIAIPLASITAPRAVTSLSALVLSVDAAYDCYSFGGFLYYAWTGSDGGGAVRFAKMDALFNQYPTIVQASYAPDLISVTIDSTASPVLWITFYTDSDTTLRTMARRSSLVPLLAVTDLSDTGTRAHLTSVAAFGQLTAFSEIVNTYSYSPNDPSNYTTSIVCTQTGTVGSEDTVARSVGLASKAFLVDGIAYFLAVYSGQYQPSYFLLDYAGNVTSKLAYANGFGYLGTQVLPSVTIVGSQAQMGYLITSLVQPVSKDHNSPSASGIYTQTGLNLATFDLSFTNLTTVEIGGSLHIPGGFLWMYDGTNVCENNFFVWPENIQITTDTSGGDITAQTYFYQVTYEWTDAQGNIHRSAPSVPFEIVTTGSSSINTLEIPTLRLTHKTGVRIVVYRWSTAQQSYYQVTSITSPLLNDPTMDSVEYVDSVDDAAILGNLLIYTTGGVVENISPPPCESLALYKSRLFLVDSEDKNSMWYSKQVIESVPVEMSDVFTQYVPPTAGISGSSGPLTALSAMDDKLIMAKANLFYYLTGVGPDNTGASNDLSDPVFITSAVGCSNQPSIAFMPTGLMFQSNKGIWLLDRGLGTSYIGAAVEDFNGQVVLSTAIIPNTTQVRFTLDNGQTLMYDYFYQRWGTFNNTDAISSVIYQGMHTFLSSRGQVFQEKEGYYQDGANPVLMSFATAWLNLAGLQGFERAYMVYLLGTFKSSHKLYITISYDYNASPSQQVIITPSQSQTTWGSDPVWGAGDVWGGTDPLEQFRVFLNRQKLQSFQFSLQEVYDSASGNAPGAGLTISGLNAVIGLKKGYVPLPASQSVG